MWLNDKNYQEYLKGITVVEISGDGCANCISLMPILKSLEDNMKSFNLHHVELEEASKKFLLKYNISRAPTILLLNDTTEVARCMGYQPEEILSIWLEAKINNIKNA